MITIFQIGNDKPLAWSTSTDYKNIKLFTSYWDERSAADPTIYQVITENLK